MSPASELDALVALITKAVEEVKAEYNDRGFAIYSRDSTQPHPLDFTEQPLPAYKQAVLAVAGVCAQMKAMTMPPPSIRRWFYVCTLIPFVFNHSELQTSNNEAFMCPGIVPQSHQTANLKPEARTSTGLVDPLMEYPDRLHLSDLSKKIGLASRQACASTASPRCLHEGMPNVTPPSSLASNRFLYSQK